MARTTPERVAMLSAKEMASRRSRGQKELPLAASIAVEIKKAAVNMWHYGAAWWSISNEAQHGMDTIQKPHGSARPHLTTTVTNTAVFSSSFIGSVTEPLSCKLVYSLTF